MTDTIFHLLEEVKEGKLRLAHVGLFLYLEIHDGESLTYAKLIKDLGIGITTMKEALQFLEKKGLIVRFQEAKGTTIRVNSSWYENHTSVGVSSFSSIYNNKELLRDFILSVVDDLREVSGKNFQYDSIGTFRLIKKRLKEGRTLEDFKRVHRNKIDWLDHPKMHIYYRPETLYADAHFESYVTEGKVLDKDLATTDKWKTPEAKAALEKNRKKLEAKMRKAGVWDED